MERLREALRIEPFSRRGLADQLVEIAGFSDLGVVCSLAVTSSLSVVLDPKAPNGCEAAQHGTFPTIRFSARGTCAQILGRLTHESTHLFADLGGLRRPHNEEDIDIVGATWRVRPKGAKAAFLACGWDGERLAAWARARDLPARYVFGRVAEVMGGVAIVKERGKRLIFAPEGSIVPGEGGKLEQLWWAYAREGQHHPVLWPGLGLWAYHDGTGAHGQVALIEPGALDMWAAPQMVG